MTSFGVAWRRTDKVKIVCGGLEGGDGDGFGRGGWFFFGLHHAFDELGDGAFAFCDLGDFGARSEDTEGGVDGDLFYGLEFGGGFGEGLGFG